MNAITLKKYKWRTPRGARRNAQKLTDASIDALALHSTVDMHQ